VDDDDVTMLMWRNENAEKYLSGSLLYKIYRFHEFGAFFMVILTV
jgi:hypothetical protein